MPQAMSMRGGRDEVGDVAGDRNLRAAASPSPNANGTADAVGKMKQFASWFTHGVPGGAALRKAIYESRGAVETLGRVEEFFEAKLRAEAKLRGAGAPSANSGQVLAREA